ncbi:hypothetical protein EC3431_3641 [Escherichia coli 3431]|nr:hypothetical protein EC3431_3641 [Escherichia coli 3431]
MTLLKVESFTTSGIIFLRLKNKNTYLNERFLKVYLFRTRIMSF